jgi:hypothetical protein
VDSLACCQVLAAAIVGNRSKRHMVRLTATKTKDIHTLTCPFSLPWSWSTSLDQQLRVRVPVPPLPRSLPAATFACTVGETHAQQEDRQVHHRPSIIARTPRAFLLVVHSFVWVKRTRPFQFPRSSHHHIKYFHACMEH